MDRTLVLIVLLIAIVANFVIIGLAMLALRRRGQRRDERGPAPRGMPAALTSPSATRPPTAGPAPSLAGEAASTPAASIAAVTFPSTPITTVAAMTDRAHSEPSPSSPASGRWVLPPNDDPKAESFDHALIDPDTGFATRRAWDEAFRSEDHRLARYGRAVTVLAVELDGLDALADRLGQGPADRLIPPVAAAMRGNARAADILARIGHTRFVALLPETDEIAAINYIERVRSACDMWLAAGAVAVRLAIGWAQPPAGGTLGDALRLADDRLNGDRRRQGGYARPVADVQPADSPDAAGEPALAPFVAGAEASGPHPALAPFTLGGANGPGASGRSEHFEDILADLLDNPGATGTIPEPISIIDDEET